jgi:hypothetical protein
MVNRSELFARPEVKKAVTEICGALRRALPEGSFGEREAHALAISDEAVRGLLQQDLQTIADGFGDEILVDGDPHMSVLTHPEGLARTFFAERAA